MCLRGGARDYDAAAWRRRRGSDDDDEGFSWIIIIPVPTTHPLLPTDAVNTNTYQLF